MISEKANITEVLKQYGPMLARIAASYERDPTLRQDLLQEISLAVWRGLSSFRGDGPLKAYIARIARNRCITHVVRAAKAPQTLILDEAMPSEEASPEDKTDRNLKRARLQHMVQSLPLEQREVIVLTLEGFKQTEVATALGVSENAVALRLKRAKTKLAEAMI